MSIHPFDKKRFFEDSLIQWLQNLATKRGDNEQRRFFVVRRADAELMHQFMKTKSELPREEEMERILYHAFMPFK